MSTDPDTGEIEHRNKNIKHQDTYCKNCCARIWLRLPIIDCASSGEPVEAVEPHAPASIGIGGDPTLGGAPIFPEIGLPLKQCRYYYINGPHRQYIQVDDNVSFLTSGKCL